MKTVLLTGAGGFIGRTTIKYLLKRGFRVHAVSSRPWEESYPNFVRHNVDLLNSEAVRSLIEAVKPTHVLHFAWYVEQAKFWNAPENEVWVTASLNLLDHFTANGGKRVVMAGTCAEYAWNTGQEILSENTSRLNPKTVYGKAKYELYLKLKAHAEEAGVSYAWGRIFFLFGECESSSRFVPSIIRALLMGQTAECLNGDLIRDFMFVDDAGEAFVRLLDSDVQGAINIADGIPKTIREIATMIAELTDGRALLTFGIDGLPEKEPERLVADISRLRNEVRYAKTTDLRDALQQTIDWWKTEL
ncbi:NAD(P)-dependent oxidoreductase [soil metagenome]